MKREPLPQIEALVKYLPHVENLGRLKSRLAGKGLIELEHCLVEILGELLRLEISHNEILADLLSEAMDETNTSLFMKAYNAYNGQRGDYARDYAIFSPMGRYFQALEFRLCELEDKQSAAARPVTLVHARQLAAIIVVQLRRMYNQAQRKSERLEQQWDTLVAKPIAERSVMAVKA